MAMAFTAEEFGNTTVFRVQVLKKKQILSDCGPVVAVVQSWPLAQEDDAHVIVTPDKVMARTWHSSQRSLLPVHTGRGQRASGPDCEHRPLWPPSATVRTLGWYLWVISGYKTAPREVPESCLSARERRRA